MDKDGAAVMPLLSVVIPHYGEPGPTLDLIGGLRAAGGTVGHEVIVADDASPIPFPQGEGYTVVRRQRNGGFGSAVNSGADVALGTHVLVLNSDAAVAPDFLEAMAEAAVAHPRSVLGPRVVEGGVPQVTTWHWPRPSGLVAEWLAPLAGLHGNAALDRFWGADIRAHESSTPAAVDWLVGACLLIPRAEFNQVGGFDEGFFMNCEEIDLQRRLRDVGVRSVKIPTVTIHHEGGGSSDPERKSGWLVDARFRYHHKWGGAKRLLVGLLAASVVNLVWNSARRLTGRDVRPLARFGHQIELIRHGWAHRSSVTPR